MDEPYWWVRCPRCITPFAWRAILGLGGQECGHCGFMFRGNEKRMAQTSGVAEARDWHASELYQLYMRGWKDGASLRPQRKDHMDCPEYDTGYANGSKASQAESTRAAKRLGHKHNILRLAGVELDYESDLDEVFGLQKRPR